MAPVPAAGASTSPHASERKSPPASSRYIFKDVVAYLQIFVDGESKVDASPAVSKRLIDGQAKVWLTLDARALAAPDAPCSLSHAHGASFQQITKKLNDSVTHVVFRGAALGGAQPAPTNQRDAGGSQELLDRARESGRVIVSPLWVEK